MDNAFDMASVNAESPIDGEALEAFLLRDSSPDVAAEPGEQLPDTGDISAPEVLEPMPPVRGGATLARPDGIETDIRGAPLGADQERIEGHWRSTGGSPEQPVIGPLVAELEPNFRLEEWQPPRSAPLDADKSEAPPAPELHVLASSIDENAAGATAALLSIGNAGKHSFTYSVDDNRFTISDGTLRLKDGIGLDFETEPTLELAVTATGSNGVILTQQVTIAVNDLNEAPTSIELSSAAIVEDAPAGTEIGTAIVFDPDAGDSHSFSLEDNADGLFAIDPLTGVISLALGGDGLEIGEHQITVRATDSGGLSHDETLTIAVEPVPTTMITMLLHDGEPSLIIQAAYGGLTVVLNGEPLDVAVLPHLQIQGTPDRDFIDLKGNFGAAGIETITLHGGDGNDYIDSSSQSNPAVRLYLHGGGGNDNFFSGAGDDTLYGGDGDDFMYGNNGNDTLYGGDGNDFMSGNNGNDTLDGGAGNDTLYGGAGADVFAFTSLGGVDSIRDFSAEEGDVIRLDGLLVGLGAVDGDSLDDYLQLSFASGNTTLRIDAAGGGAFASPDATIVVDSVDFTAGGGSQADMIQALLDNGQLVVV